LQGGISSKSERKEIAKEMLSSHLSLGGPRPIFYQGLPHSKQAFPNYAQTHYTNVVSNGVGGQASRMKTHSDVVVGNPTALTGQYESATHRQFVQPSSLLPPSTPASTSQDGQQNPSAAQLTQKTVAMNQSHWSFGDAMNEGGARVADYRTVSSIPIASEAPKIKNRPPSSSVRPQQTSSPAQEAQAAAANAAANTCPPIANSTCSGPRDPRIPFVTKAQTAASQAMTRYEPKRLVGQALAGSSVTLGHDSGKYYASTQKLTHRGIYFGSE